MPPIQYVVVDTTVPNPATSSFLEREGRVGETHGSTGDKPDIVGLRGGAARFASPRLFDQ